MPWMQQDLMSLREEFVHLVETERLPLATLCQRFGISRKTGYKWLARYQAQGVRGWRISRGARPRSRTAPRRGGGRDSGDEAPTCLSHGTAAAPTWSADCKGDFALGNGQRCYPLTIMEQASRYLLRCQGVGAPTLAAVQPWWTWVLHAYGLPATIRTDNGPPAATWAAQPRRFEAFVAE